MIFLNGNVENFSRVRTMCVEELLVMNYTHCLDEFFLKDVKGGDGQPPSGGAAVNRCGHYVTDNDEFIKLEGK